MFAGPVHVRNMLHLATHNFSAAVSYPTWVVLLESRAHVLTPCWFPFAALHWVMRKCHGKTAMQRHLQGARTRCGILKMGPCWHMAKIM